MRRPARPSVVDGRARSRSWRRDIVTAVVTVITGLVLAWVTQQLPQEEILKRAITRTLVPVLTPFYGDPGTNGITVVTVDDADLAHDEFREGWPLELSFLARRVSAILAKNPRVLFIDLLLKKESSAGDIAALVNVVCSAGSTRVYVATLGDPTTYSDTEKAVLVHSRRPVAEGVDSQAATACATAVDSQITSDELDRLQWEYPIEIKTTTPSVAVKKSAALQIFCDLKPEQCPERRPKPPAMALVWPAKSAPSNVQKMVEKVLPTSSAAPPENRPACLDGISPFTAIPGVALFQNIVWKEDPRKRRFPCPYHQVIPLRAFKFVGFTDAELHKALATNIVLLGADITGTGDKIVSPINGVMPGVHVHAMALDNLLQFKGRYKQADDFEIDPLWSAGNGFVFLSVIAIVTTLTLWNHFYTEAEPQPETTPREPGTFRRRAGQFGMLLLGLPMLVMGWPRGGAASDLRQRFLSKATFIAINVVLVGFIFVLGYVCFRQGPLSMVEYVLFPFVAHFLHLGKAIAERCFDWYAAFLHPNPWAAWAEASRKRESRVHDGDRA